MVEQIAETRTPEKEQDQARHSLVAMVSHDLRTPLTALRAMIEALNDGVVADEASVRRYLSLAQRQVENLSQLVDELFELSQLDVGAPHWKKESGSLRDLISDTLETLRAQAEDRGVQLSGAVEPTVDPVPMDAFKIQRVLSNLVQNAIRHTPAGGKISVRAQLGPGGKEAHVEILDSGEGIAPKDLPHIFEPFYRSEKARVRDGGGAGLGLTIARGIVEAHNGAIGATSESGHGARFWFTLPRN
jgi:signal transduction histidine kinase